MIIRKHQTVADFEPGEVLQFQQLQDPSERHAFLCRMSDSKLFMFHGSKHPNIEVLGVERKSQDSTEFGNRRQVFGTPDIFWAMWFALLDRSSIRFTSNSCHIDNAQTHSKYAFRVDAESYAKNPRPLTTGYIYVCPKEPFLHAHTEASTANYIFAEFGSPEPVQPLTKWAVTAEDFPYRDQICADPRTLEEAIRASVPSPD